MNSITHSSTITIAPKSSSSSATNSSVDREISQIFTDAQAASTANVAALAPLSSNSIKYLTRAELSDFLPENGPGKIAHNHNPHLPMPSKDPSNSHISENHLRDVVGLQLDGLIQICESLIVSKKLDDLIRFSWGITSLPKEMKFTAWAHVMSDRQWLLLEDIARQMHQKFNNRLNIETDNTSNDDSLISEIVEDIRLVKSILELVKERNATWKGNTIDFSDVPESKKITHDSLRGLEKKYSADFDHYVLSQVTRYLIMIEKVVRSSDILDWLKDKNHIKALFRTFEVVGEASKILSKQTTSRIPLFNLDNSKAWKALRDKLHHSKKRSMQIAKYCPEIFAFLMRQVLLKLGQEIKDVSINDAHSTGGTSHDRKAESALKMIIELCGEHRFLRVHARWKTRRCKENFISKPRYLIRTLLGLNLEESPEGFRRIRDDFETSWQKDGKPYLKVNINWRTVYAKVHALYAIGRPSVLSQEDIRKLKIPSRRIVEKADLVRRLKELLRSLATKLEDKEIKSIREQYYAFVADLVFISDKNDECDVVIYNQLKAIVDRRVAIVKGLQNSATKTPFNEQMFGHQDGFRAATGEIYCFFAEWNAYVDAKLSTLQTYRISDKSGVIVDSNLEEILERLKDFVRFIRNKTDDNGAKLIRELFTLTSNKNFKKLQLDKEFKKQFENHFQAYGECINSLKKHILGFQATDDCKEKLIESIDELKKVLDKIDKQKLASFFQDHGLDEIEIKLMEFREQLRTNQYDKNTTKESKPNLHEFLQKLENQKEFIGLLGIPSQQMDQIICKVKEKLGSLNESNESKTACVQAIEDLRKSIVHINSTNKEFPKLFRQKLLEAIKLKAEFEQKLTLDVPGAKNAAKQFKAIIAAYFALEPGELKTFFESILLELDIELARVSEHWLVEADQTIDELTKKANAKLARQFILDEIAEHLTQQENYPTSSPDQKIISSNKIGSIQLATGSSAQNTNQTQNKKHKLTSVRCVYLHTFFPSGPTKEEKLGRTLGEKRWKNFFERKINGYILSVEERESILGMVDSEKLDIPRKKIWHKLERYLNASEGFKLAGISSFAHAEVKIQEFLSFLKDECGISSPKDGCSVPFPVLKCKTSRLLRLFKKANGIDASEAKADSHPLHFAEKVENISKGIVSKISRLDHTHELERDVLSIAAEYEMQDIGELAQLIPKRPSVWYRGRHILSTRHLKYISLLRKMMAHYPLMLSPEVMHWNLTYLAFETDTKLKGSSAKRALTENDVEFVAQDRLKSTRSRLTLKLVKDRKFDIVDAFERKGFDPKKVEVLYPLHHTQENNDGYLHPLGQLILMAHEALPMENDEHVHALMDLELFLSYELDLPVKVIGKRNNEYVNETSGGHIPRGYLSYLIQNKLILDYWIISKESYGNIRDKLPWAYVDLENGLKMSYSDHAYHKVLEVFMNVAGVGVTVRDVAGFLRSENPESALYKKLTSLCRKGRRSCRINNHIHMLFRLFNPPETLRQNTILCPDNQHLFLPLFTVDTKGNHLFKMGQKKSDMQITPAIQPYYQGVNRIDVVNSRSLLDVSRLKITDEEVKYIARYTLKILRAHSNDICRGLSPMLDIDNNVVPRIVGLCINDPVLVENRKVKNTISVEIKQIIDEEANELSKRICKWVEEFIEQNNDRWMIAILKWLEAKKRLEVILRRYYAENRLRIKGPLLQMDEVSKRFFDKAIDDHGYGWTEFDFLSSFSKFYDTVMSDFMKENRGEYTMAMTTTQEVNIFSSRSSSERVKTFVIENEIRKVIHPICREIITCTNELLDVSFPRPSRPENSFALKSPALKRQHPTIYAKEVDRLEQSGRDATSKLLSIQDKCHHLFAMIHSPQIFVFLSENLGQGKTLNSKATELLKSALVTEFSDQYLSGAFLGESIVAEATPEIGKKTSACLSDVRDDLEQRAAIRKAKRDFMQVKSDPVAASKFRDRWQGLYGAAFGPQYFENTLQQARIILNYVLHKKTLPSEVEKDESQNAAYWDLVERFPVEISFTYRQSALKMTFKHFILERELTFEDLLKNETLRNEFESHPKLRNLIGAYVTFLPKELELSERHGYLTRKLQFYKETMQDYLDYMQSQNTTTVQIQEFERRLNVIRKEFERMFAKFKESVNEVKAMTFFNMLKLSVSLNHFVENKQQMSDKHEEQGAFRLLLGDQDWVYFEIRDIFTPELVSLNCND